MKSEERAKKEQMALAKFSRGMGSARMRRYYNFRTPDTVPWKPVRFLECKGRLRRGMLAKPTAAAQRWAIRTVIYAAREIDSSTP
jgi:hypothetical protein